MGCVLESYPFDACPSGWTSSGVANDWQCAPPVGPAGPAGDHTGGGSLWATDASGNANNCEDAKLVSPVIDLSGLQGQTLTLSFWHWYDFRDCTVGALCPAFACQFDMSSYSGGVVEVLSNGMWTQVAPMGGYGNGGQTISCSYSDAACTTCSLEGKSGFTAAGAENAWNEALFDITPYASATFQARFSFASHDAYTCYPEKGGWYIDDVEITSPVPCP